jgi:hypothetical protein
MFLLKWCLNSILVVSLTNQSCSIHSWMTIVNLYSFHAKNIFYVESRMLSYERQALMTIIEEELAKFGFRLERT